jgi:hypothetical protein
MGNLVAGYSQDTPSTAETEANYVIRMRECGRRTRVCYRCEVFKFFLLKESLWEYSKQFYVFGFIPSKN